uniref:Uncharacterized protein n=1 Tax=Polysiphonia sertularioides TaxID=945028 RepID=A0A1Z1MGE1_9FLOR|nr:hypothetical protein [Polysiphonia sertularioides]
MRKEDLFLRYVNGSWSKQERLIIFSNKNHMTLNGNLNFEHDYRKKSRMAETNIVIAESDGQKLNYTNSILYCTNLSHKNDRDYFVIKLKGKYLLKIRHVNIKLDLVSKEYIYIVNKKIIVSVMILLDYNKRYLGIKTSSYIKLRELIKSPKISSF